MTLSDAERDGDDRGRAGDDTESMDVEDDDEQHADDDEYNYWIDLESHAQRDQHENDEFETNYRKRHRKLSKHERGKLDLHRMRKKRRKKHALKHADKERGDGGTVQLKRGKKERLFSCSKCRRSFATNRALASHQRAHKNKVPPPPKTALLISPNTNGRMLTQCDAAAASPAINRANHPDQHDNHSVSSTVNTNRTSVPQHSHMNTNQLDINGITTNSNEQQQESENILSLLPNLNIHAQQGQSTAVQIPNIPGPAELSSPSVNLTRLAMPSINPRKRYQIKNSPGSYRSNAMMAHEYDLRASTASNDDNQYKYHCDKCQAAFFYPQDMMKHRQYAECSARPYLCPFCERPFKSCLSVKKHCVNLHSSIINWDALGDLFQFVREHEDKFRKNNPDKDVKEMNLTRCVRRFARDYFLERQQEKEKEKQKEREKQHVTF